MAIKTGCKSSPEMLWQTNPSKRGIANDQIVFSLWQGLESVSRKDNFAKAPAAGLNIFDRSKLDEHIGHPCCEGIELPASQPRSERLHDKSIVCASQR